MAMDSNFGTPQVDLEVVHLATNDRCLVTTLPAARAFLLSPGRALSASYKPTSPGGVPARLDPFALDSE